MGMQKTSILTETPISTSDSATQNEKQQAAYFVKNGYGKPMSQYEIDLDKRISVAGLLQAVVSSPLICGMKGTQSIEGALDVIEKVATGVIEINKRLASK